MSDAAKKGFLISNSQASRAQFSARLNQLAKEDSAITVDDDFFYKNYGLQVGGSGELIKVAVYKKADFTKLSGGNKATITSGPDDYVADVLGDKPEQYAVVWQPGKKTGQQLAEHIFKWFKRKVDSLI